MIVREVCSCSRALSGWIRNTFICKRRFNAPACFAVSASTLAPTQTIPAVTDSLPSASKQEYYVHRDEKGRGFRVNLAKSHQIVGVRSTRGSTDIPNEDRYRSATVRLAEGKIYHQWLYFGVFDGHGGSRASDYASANLHRNVENCTVGDYKDILAYYRNLGGDWANFSPKILSKLERSKSIDDLTIEQRLTMSFLRTDMKFSSQGHGPSQGSTGSVALVRGENDEPVWACKKITIQVAHVGDTRVILCNADGRAVPLTRDHHPTLPDELERLKRYGDHVIQDAMGDVRIGGLSNSRALGDVNARQYGISAEPELTKFEADATELGFLCLVTDGISSVMNDQEIVDVVKQCHDPTSAAMHLVDVADQLGSEDNETAMVVRLPGWSRPTPDYSRDLREYRMRRGRYSRTGLDDGGVTNPVFGGGSGGGSSKYSYEDAAVSDAEREFLLKKLYRADKVSSKKHSSTAVAFTGSELAKMISESQISLVIDTGILSSQERTDADVRLLDDSNDESPMLKHDVIPLMFSVLGKNVASQSLTLDEARKAWMLLGVRVEKTGEAIEAERKLILHSKEGVVKGPPGVGPTVADGEK